MKKMLVVLAVVVALVMPSWVRADSIIPSLISITPDAGTFLWEYNMDLSGTSQAVSFTAVPGDVSGSAMLELFDFHGFIEVVSVPAGWSSATFLVGPIAGQPEALCGNLDPCGPDNPGLWNILVGYGPGGATIPGPANLGNFVIRSSLGELGLNVDSYFAQDQSKGNPSLGIPPTPQGNDGFYHGPAPVPEPTTMLLLGTGLLGIGSRLRKRSKKETPKV